MFTSRTIASAQQQKSIFQPTEKQDMSKENPKYDPTIENILKSIGFDFEMSKRMQEKAQNIQVQKPKEEEEQFGINQCTSFLQGGLPDDLKTKLFQKTDVSVVCASNRDAKGGSSQRQEDWERGRDFVSERVKRDDEKDREEQFCGYGRERRRSMSPERGFDGSWDRNRLERLWERDKLQERPLANDRTQNRTRDRSPDTIRDQLAIDGPRKRTRGWSPDRIGNKTPDRIRDRSLDRNRNRSPDRNKNRLPDRNENRSPDRNKNRSPDRIRNRSPVRKRDRSLDIFRERSPDRFRDKITDRSRNRLPDKSRDRSRDRSHDRHRVRGRSPKRIRNSVHRTRSRSRSSSGLSSISSTSSSRSREGSQANKLSEDKFRNHSRSRSPNRSRSGSRNRKFSHDKERSYERDLHQLSPKKDLLASDLAPYLSHTEPLSSGIPYQRQTAPGVYPPYSEPYSQPLVYPPGIPYVATSMPHMPPFYPPHSNISVPPPMHMGLPPPRPSGPPPPGIMPQSYDYSMHPPGYPLPVRGIPPYPPPNMYHTAPPEPAMMQVLQETAAVHTISQEKVKEKTSPTSSRTLVPVSVNKTIKPSVDKTTVTADKKGTKSDMIKDNKSNEQDTLKEKKTITLHKKIIKVTSSNSNRTVLPPNYEPAKRADHDKPSESVKRPSESPRKYMTIKERNDLFKQRDEGKKRIELLEKELTKLKKQQNELMRKKRRQKDGHKDPILVQNSILQDEISNQISKIRKNTEEKMKILKDSVIEPDGPPSNKKLKSENRDPKSSRSSTSKRSESKDYKKEETKGKEEKNKEEEIEFYDPGDHWCSVCNFVNGSIYSVLQHLHSKNHWNNMDAYHRPWVPSEMKNQKQSAQPGKATMLPVKGIFYCEKLCICCTSITNFSICNLDNKLNQGY